MRGEVASCKLAPAQIKEPSMTATDQAFDPAKVEAFGGRLQGILSGALLSYMVDIGDRTGLFVALAAGPATSEQLAERAGLQERYVREWLGAMVTGGLVEFDVASETASLPPEHAILLAGPGSMTSLARANTVIGKHVPGVARAFREGGGVPYADFCPEFSDVMDAMGRGVYDQFLVDGYLPLAPGLTERLTAGARVADIACGAGHVLVLLARAFPKSTFVGYDLDDGGIARARAEANGAGLDNVTFEVQDIARLQSDELFDVVFIMDALHDQVDPTAVLQRAHEILKPDGIFFLREPKAGDTIGENIGNPFAPVVYSVSTLHCLTVSLAHGGAGIGTAFGEQLARKMLTAAGFADPSLHPAPGHPFDAVYVTTPTR
jgi:2-polyprenyl-3-methyl-5-hydroxy-6-metoxy-1,4-benzoquinol methylase